MAPQAVAAGTLTATPSTLASVFAKAQPGQTIELAGGNYGTFRGGSKPGNVTLKRQPGANVTMALDFSPARNVTVAGVTLTNVEIAGQSQDITIRNSDIPGQVTLRELTNSNVLLSNNVHRDWNKCNGCSEGRVYASRSNGPSGITVRDSEFRGGVSDGIQNGSDGMRIIGNTFHDLEEGTPNGVHTDAIQLYGSSNTVIRGNYFRNVPDAIMSPDGADHEVIENNVIQGDRGGYPYAVTLWSDNGSIIRHNTFADGACLFNLRCGIVSIGSKSGDPAGRGTIIEDNILNDIGIGDGKATLASRSHNLLAGGRAQGTGELRGKPDYIGGPSPASRSGYALAPKSAGRRAAGDGLDIGAVIDRATACKLAKRQLRKAKAQVRTAKRGVRRASGRAATHRARVKLHKAKTRLKKAKQRRKTAC